jgi:hypothetical protein
MANALTNQRRVHFTVLLGDLGGTVRTGSRILLLQGDQIAGFGKVRTARRVERMRGMSALVLHRPELQDLDVSGVDRWQQEADAVRLTR